MNTTSFPTSSAAAKFWPKLKGLSDRDKLNLIVMLSSSMAHPEEETVNSSKGWTKSFAGKWQDSRSSEEIIADLRAARPTHNFDVEL